MTSLLLVICSQTGHATSQRGKFHTYGLQASAEVGKKYMFGKGWYLDPELQLTYGHLRAAKYLTDTGGYCQDQKLQ